MIMALLERFRKKQLRNMNPKNTAVENDSPPDRETIAAMENEGLPSVNKRKGGNRIVTVLGFVFVFCLAAALIVAVNSSPKNKRPKEAKQQEPESISNRLPPISIPPPQPLQPSPVSAQATPPVPLAQNHPQQPPLPAKDNAKTGMEWHDRKLGGSLLIDAKPGTASATPTTAVFTEQGGHTGQNLSGKTDLGGKLDATITVSRSAAMLRDRNFLITKGTNLDCVLETAMDSSLPGLTTCRLTRDVYSDNGRVLLLDRGSQLVGEYQGGVKQGQVRLFVLWTRAKTPNGVIISLDSPGADALGRSGHEGWVDNHFWQRFGAAILMSLVKDSVTVLAQNSGSGSNNTNIYGNTGTGAEKIVEKMLDSTVNIPPTIIKNQGEHIQVMVARDLDFSSVYGLKAE